MLALDLRALALARIFSGLVLVIDLIHRISHGRIFYSSQGLYPQSLMREMGLMPGLPSVHLISDQWSFLAPVLWLQVVVAVGLLLGFRTRLCTVLNWFLMVSLQLRNPLVNNSGDSLLLAFLFWAMFLPWGECWSLDSRGKPLPEKLRVLSGGTVGFCSQVFCLYFFAALHKLNPMWWSEGNAVFYALSVGHHATSWADWLLPHQDFLRILSRVVIVGEFVIALLALAPFPRVRLVALVTAALMHLGFGTFLAIGTFQFVPLIGLLALLPVFGKSDCDDKLGSWWSVPLLACCLLTWAVNIEMLGRGKPVLLPQKVTGYASVLVSDQHWNVFSGQGLEHSGWFAIEVRTEDGKTYDAWRSDAEWTREPPAEIWRTYPDDRWRKWMMNLPSLPRETGIADHFARWSLEEWNRRHPENPAVRVRVWHAVYVTSLSGPPEPTRWIQLSEALAEG